MFTQMLTLYAIFFVPCVLTRGNITGLLQALNSSGLDQFANATTSLNDTAIGQQVLFELSQGNKTIFAPTDSAWASVNITNETTLADIVSYHVVSGNLVNETQTYPNVTVGRTLLSDPSLVRLEGNQSQVLIWSKMDNGSLFVTNQGCRPNVTVVNATDYNNSAILAIDTVLIPPLNLSAVLSNPAYNLTLLMALLKSATLPNGISALDALNSARGVTLFAPNNAGIQAARGSLSDILKNATALLNVALNHVINGTSVYSNEIFAGHTLTSAAGQNFTFSANSTGPFVSVGGSNQVQIAQENVLASNGVLYIIDGVMINTNANAAASSSALASATSAVAQTSYTTSPSSSPTSTPTSTSRGMENLDATNNWRVGMLLGMIVGFGQFV